MSPRHALASFARILLLLLTVLAGCRQGPAAPAPAGSAAAAKPSPTTVAEAEALKRGGVSWTNEEIRVYYNQVVSTIAAASEQWKRDGLPAEEQARRASEIRHDARVTCRAMMTSAAEVEDLRRRDQEKYGNPDGPTFEQLVDKAKKKGLRGDAVYDEILASAQRTDEATNAAFGIKKRGP
jgi:hypothetical protein